MAAGQRSFERVSSLARAEMPPYIRRTKDDQLLVTVAEPGGARRTYRLTILLTRDAREVDSSLFVVRISIPALFVWRLR